MKGILIGVDIYLLTNLIFFAVCLIKDGSHITDEMNKEFESLSKAQRVVVELLLVIALSIILLPASLTVIILKGGKK